MDSDLIFDAARRAVSYLSGRTTRSVFPDAAAIQQLDALDMPLPDGPRPAEAVLEELDRCGSPATVVSTGGRYFGFVTGGTEPAGAAASILAGAWDQNVALPAMSPAAARIDTTAARWVCELLGLPADALAAFCSGASVANLTCIIAARDALLRRHGWDVGTLGMAGAPALRVVAGAEAHVSLLKALRVAGLGTDAIEWVATDEAGRMRPDATPNVDELTLVLLQAGNVNTGHSDPFAKLIPRMHQAGAWVHVDGAFGLWAAASPRYRPLVAGVELADSWATDAHKFLNAPYDSGIAIVARPGDLRRAMAIDAAYLVTNSERALMHLGLQMSQRARAVETWALIASLGRSGIAELVDRACDRAAQFAAALQAGGAEILAPVVLNQLLVAFGDDTITDAVIRAVQADGTCWAGGTTWQGRRAMRISVSDSATTQRDVELSSDAVLRCWRSQTG
jgi:glutamate/tyrosine decarboxylase-like PLP-dependent enzyme